MSWVFYDTNVYGDCNDEYDISGEEYEKLLEVCFKYCDTLMLKVVRNNLKNIERFEAYRTVKPAGVDEKRLQSITTCGDRFLKDQFRFYKLCPGLFELMKETSNSIFGWTECWNNNPDDPVFIRADGSIFFDSTTHEGELELFPRDEEDVAEIISNKLWLPGDMRLKFDLQF